jgi:hypothetical protein
MAMAVKKYGAVQVCTILSQGHSHEILACDGMVTAINGYKWHFTGLQTGYLFETISILYISMIEEHIK